jgi:hypothetical protein
MRLAPLCVAQRPHAAHLAPLLIILLAAAFGGTIHAADAAFELNTCRPCADVAIPPHAFQTKPARASQPAEFACQADLATTGATFLGFETTLTTEVLAHAVGLRFAAAGMANSRFLEISLQGDDGVQCSMAVPLEAGRWQDFEIPMARLLSTAPARERFLRPAASNAPLKLRFLVRNLFPGANGFSLRGVALVRGEFDRTIVCSPETTVPLQRDSFLLVRVMSRDGALCSGWLNCYTSARNEVLLPEQVRLDHGWARVPLFVRTPGPHTVSLYDPISGAHAVTTVYGRADGLVVRLEAEQFEKQQVIIAPGFLKPRATFEGGRLIPRSVLLTALDHRGQRVLSQILNAAELSTGQARVLVPLPGLLEIRARVFAEDLGPTPSSLAAFPIAVGAMPGDAATSAAIALPDRVTTEAVGGYIVALQDAPATATLLGEDRMALWALARVPAEVRLPSTLFGVNQPEIPAMDMVALGNTGRRLLGWQGRIGPIWVRLPYALDEIVANPNAYSWATVQELAKQVKNLGFRPVVDVPVPPPAAIATGIARADADTTFSRWITWLDFYRRNVAQRIRIFALSVRAEAGTTGSAGACAPALLDSAFASAWRVLDVDTTPSLVAGFGAPFDPIALRQHLPNAVRNRAAAVLMEPSIPRPDASPNANAVDLQIRLARHALRDCDLLKRPLWLGPVAWSSHPLWGTEATQANYLARLYTIAAAEGANRVFWGDLRDRATNPWEAAPPDFSGLLDTQMRPKPAAIACNLAVFMLTQTRPHEPESTGSLRVYPFDIELHSMRWPGRLYVAWTEGEPSTTTLSLPIGKAGWYAFDYLGAGIAPLRVEPERRAPTAAADDDTTRIVTFPVSPEPLYIWDVTTIPRRVPHRHENEPQNMEAR